MKRNHLRKIIPLISFVLCFATAAFAGSTAFDLVISAGIPQIGNGQYTTTGNTYFVDSGSSYRCNAADCGTYDKPFSTVDYAIGRTTANNGDIIFVAPGHAETLTAANGFDADVAGVRIVGLGEGANRPTFTFTSTAADVAIGAANVTIENVRFLAGISDVVRAISVEAAGDNFTLKNCDFPVPGTSTFEFLDAIILASGADGATFIGNSYRDGSSSAANTWLNADAGIVANLRIIENDIYGRFAVAPIHSSRADTGTLIQNNVIGNTITGQFAVEFTSTATGMCVDNRFYSDAVATTLDPGSLDCAGNIMVNGIDSGGVTVPIAGSVNAVPTADSTDNVYIRDVVGNKTDAAATVSTDKSIVANVKQVTNQGQKIDGASLAVNPTAGSLARFVASGGTALGTQLAASKSIIDALGSDGTTLADTATSIVGIIGVPTDSDHVVDSSLIVANADGSLFERGEALQIAAAPSKNHPNYLAVSTGTFDTTGTWSTVASHEIATVTGCVRMLVLPECTATVVSVGDNGTIALGDETTTNSIIAASTLGAGVMATGELWVDATLTRTILTRTQLDAIEFAVCNGKDIGYTVGTNALSGGSMKFHIWWTPLDSTGAVTAGVGGTL